MKKKIAFAICVCLAFSACSLKGFAQADLRQTDTQALSANQQEKEKFLFGFYTAYMSSLIYNVEGLDKMLKEKYVDRKLRAKPADADILLNAQDCIEANLSTLRVELVDDPWYRVTFLWPSYCPTEPAQRHTLLVKLGRNKHHYKIVDIKVAH